MWKLFVDLDEDFKPSEAKEHNLGFISMPVIIDGVPTLPYIEGELKDYEPHAFFERLRGGLVPKTSGLSPEQYRKHFEPYAKEGTAVLYAHFSEAMSGTFNAMRIAVDDLKKEPLVLRSKESETRTLFMAALSSSGHSIDEFNVVLEIDNIMTIKEIVSKGEYISVLPRSACHSYGDKEMLSLRPIENLNMSREVSIVYPSDSIDRDFLDALVLSYKEKMAR